ncbi:MAG: hypothetical protein K0S37_1725 [Microbacterium sp.]|jgi:hypothetical protein|nr:hypothetical protein [Microbacterium sp.]
MTRSESLESDFFSPLTADWTIAGLLEWIGADDARCHDERLFGILDAIDQALHPGSSRVRVGVVTLVRSVAMRVSAERSTGERTLGEVFGVRESAAGVPPRVGVLVPA